MAPIALAMPISGRRAAASMMNIRKISSAPTAMEKSDITRKKVVTKLPAWSAISSRLRLNSMTRNSDSSSNSVSASPRTSSSSSSSRASVSSFTTSSSDSRLFNSAVKSSFASSARSSTTSARSSSDMSSSLAWIAETTASCRSSSFSRDATSRSLNRTRSSLVTSLLCSTPPRVSPSLETMMVLISPSRPKISWTWERGIIMVGSRPARPPFSTIPLTVTASGWPST